MSSPTIEHKQHNKYHQERITHHPKGAVKEMTKLDALNRGTGYGKGSGRRDNLTVYQSRYDEIFRKDKKK